MVYNEVVMISKEWDQLSATVQDNLFYHIENEILSYSGNKKHWSVVFSEILRPFNAMYDLDSDLLHFESEACYNWFLLRWT